MSVKLRALNLVCAFALLATAATAQVPGAGADARGGGTPAVRDVIHESLSGVQRCVAAEDLACARRRVEALLAREDLTGYERALAAQLSAHVHQAQGRPDAALDDYETLLAQPGLPAVLRREALYTASQLHLEREAPEEALAKLEPWFELTERPEAEAYVLRAQVQYQLQRWSDGERSISEALRLADREGRQPQESWYQLAHVFAYELGGCKRSQDRLETLLERWPKRDYYVQLAGCAGQLGDTERQLELMDIAAAYGWLTGRESLAQGWMLMSAARYDAAGGALRRAARLLDPAADTARSHVANAATLVSQERYDDARQALQLALEQLDAGREASRRSP